MGVRFFFKIYFNFCPKLCYTSPMNKLHCKINLKNLVNREHNYMLPILLERFRPLVGQKVVKESGVLLSKFLYLIPKSSVELMVCQTVSKYCLTFVVRGSSACADSAWVYADSIIYVGFLEGQTLCRLNEYSALPVDYSYDKLIKSRELVRETREKLRLAEFYLAGFGETD